MVLTLAALAGLAVSWRRRSAWLLGLLWLARALEHAPDDASDLQWYARTNLAAWRWQHSVCS